MSQTIPINLIPLPTPTGIEYSTIDQLLTVISNYLSGQISTDVSFFAQGASDPTSYVTKLFYNTSQNVWKGWDTGTGSYLSITPFQYGDVKNSFVDGDEISNGWLVLNGRLITGIQGLSLRQGQVLAQLFPSGTLPQVTPLQNLSGLPTNGTFSGISIPEITPPENQIQNLPFSGSYVQIEAQDLAKNTETLRDSTSTLNDAAISIRDNAETLLEALNGGNSSASLYAKVFIGYP